MPPSSLAPPQKNASKPSRSMRDGHPKCRTGAGKTADIAGRFRLADNSRAAWDTASKLGPRTELRLESLTPAPRNQKSAPVDALIVCADAGNPFASAMIWQSDMPVTRFILPAISAISLPMRACFYNEAAPKLSVLKPDCPAQITSSVLKTVVIATVSAPTRSRLGSRRDEFRRQRC